jgi:cation diffusion facilitator family transporter
LAELRTGGISTDDRKKVKALRLTLLFGIVLLFVKFTAWYFTHSYAILTDALESIVNVIAGGFALFSIYYASLPKDENHPYGHGKIEFISAGFEGGLIFIAGILIIINAIYALFRPPSIHQVDLGVILTVVGGAANYLMGRSLVKMGKHHQSLLMIANGKHLISDTLSSVGLVSGLILILLTGLLWIDNVMAVIFGGIILITGFRILKTSVNSLLDEADYEKLELIIRELQRHRKDKWIDIHNLRVIKYGPNLHVDCHITLPWYDSLEESHAAVNEVETLVKETLGGPVEFFIHADPCEMPRSCSICQVKECTYRQADFERKIDWELSNMLPNQKHSL